MRHLFLVAVCFSLLACPRPPKPDGTGDCSKDGGTYVLMLHPKDAASCVTPPPSLSLTISVGVRDPDSGQWKANAKDSTGATYTGFGETASTSCHFLLDTDNPGSPGAKPSNLDFTVSNGTGTGVVTGSDGKNCLWQADAAAQLQ